MAAARRPRRPKSRLSPTAQTALHRIRLQLDRLGTKEGYIVVSHHGPYDHNEFDSALPFEHDPLVFKPLYEAVEYLHRYRRQVPDEFKFKILHLEDKGEPEMLSSQVVWRSWVDKAPWLSDDGKRPVGMRDRMRVSARRRRRGGMRSRA